MTTRGTLRRQPWMQPAVAVLTVLLGRGGAHAAVLCGAKDRITGQLREGASLRVRSACRTTEVQADLASLGLSAQPQLVVRFGNMISTNVGLSTSASCAPGEVATGGGALSSGSGGAVAALRSSLPQPETSGAVPVSWRVSVQNLAAPTGLITSTAYVVCAAP